MKKYYLLLYLILLFALYFLSILNGRFDLDDNELLDPPHIRSGISIENIKTMLTWGKHVDFLPVHNFSHMLEATISPGSEKLIHFNNIIIFLLIVIALYFVFQKYFLLNSLSAFLATIAVTINGTSHELVVWINGRKDSLSLLFILVFILYTNAFLQKNYKNLNWNYVFKLVSILFLYSLAIFTKSNAVVVLALLIFCFLWEYRSELREIPKSFWLFFVVSLVITINYLLMVRNFYSTVNKMVWHVETITRIQMHLVALGHHVFDWIIPVFQILHPRQTDLWFELNFNYIYFGILLWVVVFGILLNVHKLPKKMARSFFWIIFFYAPVSGLIFEHPHFYSARYAYLSLIGFAGLMFQIIDYYKSRLWFKKFNFVWMFLFLLYFGTHLHHNFNAVNRWQESALVWKHSHLSRPNDPTLASYFLRAILRDDGKSMKLLAEIEPYKNSLISFLEENCSNKDYINKALYSCSHFRETMFVFFPNKENANHLLDDTFYPWIRCKALLYLKRYNDIEILLQKRSIDVSKIRENEGMRNCRFLYLCFAKGIEAADEYKNELIKANIARQPTLEYWNLVSRNCAELN
ncbi:MAG TPA: hypothetical protein QF468_07075 [Nitrospinota bacterium]|nr:hypothetical protein [Nitrospinota bacterium]